MFQTLKGIEKKYCFDLTGPHNIYIALDNPFTVFSIHEVCQEVSESLCTFHKDFGRGKALHC
jgi:hypothetical protein